MRRRDTRPVLDRDSKLEPFVGRGDVIDGFNQCLRAELEQSPPVLCYHGIGGQGKTTLLRQLIDLCKAAGAPAVYLDLDQSRSGGRYVQPEVTLHAIASGLEGEMGFFCERFLLVRSLLETRRTGRRWDPPGHLWGKHVGPFVDLALAIINCSAIGLAVSVARAAWSLMSPQVKEWFSQQVTESEWQEKPLRELDEKDLLDLLPEALAADFESLIERHERRPVILLDTYEDLQRSSEDPQDSFIRALAEGTDSIILVIAGRLPLNWGQSQAGQPPNCDSVWEVGVNLQLVELVNLTKTEVAAYLRQRAQGEHWTLGSDLVGGLFSMTGGFPMAVGLSADFAEAVARKQSGSVTFNELQSSIWHGIPPSLSDRLRQHLPPKSRNLLDLNGDTRELLTQVLLHRLLREVDRQDELLIHRSCVPRYLTDRVLQAIWPEVSDIRSFRLRLTGYSFVDPALDHDERWVVHKVVRDTVLNTIAHWPALADIHRQLDGFYSLQASSAQDEEGRFEAEIEAAYHRIRYDAPRGYDDLVRVFNSRSYSSVTQRHRAPSVLAALSDTGAQDATAKAAECYFRAVILRNEWVLTQGSSNNPRTEALGLLRQSLQHQSEIEPTHLLGATQLAVGVVCRELADLREACLWLGKARLTAAACSDQLLEARAMLDVAKTPWRGNPDFGSMRLLGEAEALFVGIRGGAPEHALAVIEAKVGSLKRSGRVDDAFTEIERGHLLRRQIGRGYAGFLFHIPELLMAKGRSVTEIGNAIKELRLVLDDLQAPKSIMETTYLRVCAFFEEYQGRHQEAIVHFRECLVREHEVHSSIIGTARTLCEIGRCLTAAGDSIGGYAHLQVAADIWGAMEHVEHLMAAEEATRAAKLMPEHGLVQARARARDLRAELRDARHTPKQTGQGNGGPTHTTG